MTDNYPDLKLGDDGDDVRILQQKLKILNFYPASITGSFDKSTEGAVELFQEANNLDVNGMVDLEVWQLLFEQTEPDIPGVKATFQNVEENKEEIENIQKKLKSLLYYEGYINGENDMETVDAIQTFQLNNQLTSTGELNTNTLYTISNDYTKLTNCTEEVPNNLESYKVENGDTLYSIAKKFNTTVDNLKKINSLISDILTVNQKILVPKNEINIENTYTVEKGDTLYSIAKKFNTTIDELKRLNNLTSNTLTIGQVLNIVGNNSNNNDNTYTNYTVKRGDTLYSIARIYNVSVDNLMMINNLSNSILSIGQILKVPINDSNNYITYYVKKGDTLYSIASKYNTSVDKIKSINNLTTNTLSINQMLLIPST